MSVSFPIDEAHLVAMFVQCITYGVYLGMLYLCVRALFWDRQGVRKKPNWAIVFVAFLMATIATIDVSMALRYVLDAFISYTGPGGPDGAFDDSAYWLNVIKVSGLYIDLITRADVSDRRWIHK